MRFILILGFNIQRKTTFATEFIPSDILKSRLDLAYQLYSNPPLCKNSILCEEQKIIVSGADPNYNGITESKVMKNYLLSLGVNKNDIIEESYANNTIENISLVMSLLMARDDLYSKNNELVVVTSNFHMKRTKIICGYYFDTNHLPVTFRESHEQISMKIYNELHQKEQDLTDELEIMISDSKRFL